MEVIKTHLVFLIRHYLQPANADLWNLKGIALRSLGRYDEASECYNKSLEIEPRDKESS